MNRAAVTATVTRIVDHLREPLYRNGYALVFSSAATSGLGMIYWIVAARTYSPEIVGLNSAVISAMIFLANFSQLNLHNALNRFLPGAGKGSRRMVLYSYLISLTVAALSSLFFVFGIRIWAPSLGFLGSSLGFILWFVGATMSWCIFVLQDSALVGMRQAIWVPIENLFFALAKIGLLVVFVAILPLYGVLASWTLSVVITILPTNVLIFGRLLQRHIKATLDKAENVTVPQIAKYVAGDYSSSIVNQAVTNLLPVLIVARIGASAGAYYYLSWTIAYVFYLVSRNMGMSLITEASMDQANLRIYSQRLFLQTARLLLPLLVIVVIGAPYILRLFGKTYSAEGSTLLRLLCLSALPYMVISIYVSIVRIQRRLIALFVSLTTPYVLVIILSILLLGRFGVLGVGIAWLVGQSLVAVILLATEFRKLWGATPSLMINGNDGL